mmetsp:Transcript_3705/g.8293  ORF Transcript_3705/g.8293 Transcript_3705/m.8293 type:complete len:508 (-) Transcript_3705:233-1756(-)
MQVSSFALTVFAASAASIAYGFAPMQAFSRHAVTSASASASDGPVATATTLFISSWGKTGLGLEPDQEVNLPTDLNPDTNIQSYLDEPDIIAQRDNLDGTCLVSGFVNSKDRSDQFVFDLLNYEDNAFAFKKIVAFVNDEKSAKKRLLSRSARYTGLLDKLDFKEAAVADALPLPAQLEGARSWLASIESNDDLLDQVKAIAALAKDAPDLDNISVMVTNAAGDIVSAEDRSAAVQALKDTGKEYTLLVMGKLEDRDEGKKFYKFRDFDSEDDEDALLPPDAVFSREEAMRMATETLQLDAGSCKALTFSEVYDTNTTEAKLIKGLREAGYVRCQEIDHVLNDGFKEYQEALDEYDVINPGWREGVTHTEAWWEDPEFLRQLDEAKLKDRGGRPEEKVVEEEPKDERTKEVEKIAAEWAKREFFSRSMAGTVDQDLTQGEFIESVWDRALFEGDLKFRQLNGEDADAEAELLDFKAQQERKQQAMLKKAKAELQEIFDEEDLGDVDE